MQAKTLSKVHFVESSAEKLSGQWVVFDAFFVAFFVFLSPPPLPNNMFPQNRKSSCNTRSADRSPHFFLALPSPTNLRIGPWGSWRHALCLVSPHNTLFVQSCACARWLLSNQADTCIDIFALEKETWPESIFANTIQAYLWKRLRYNRKNLVPWDRNYACTSTSVASFSHMCWVLDVALKIEWSELVSSFLIFLCLETHERHRGGQFCIICWFTLF